MGVIPTQEESLTRKEIPRYVGMTNQSNALGPIEVEILLLRAFAISEKRAPKDIADSEKKLPIPPSVRMTIKDKFLIFAPTLV